MASKQKVQLPEDQEKVMREGMALYEMTQSEGWKIVSQWLSDRAFHTWVDPRTIEGADAAGQWQFRELNAFHASNNAKELLDSIAQAISQSEYLQKVASGEIKQKGMKL